MLFCMFEPPFQLIHCLMDDRVMSDTIDSGMPWVANKVIKFLIVAADDADFTGSTSIHLEKASTTTKSI